MVTLEFKELSVSKNCLRSLSNVNVLIIRRCRNFFSISQVRTVYLLNFVFCFNDSVFYKLSLLSFLVNCHLSHIIFQAIEF